MAEEDVQVVALKDALCNQYNIMKNLYAELEEEREASASAATEALSMILRLQREKAVEKMEASQYKRMAEEKMQHAEECLSILKEVTQQKEMEITTLQYQLQAYKQKLAGLGVNVPDIEELAIYDNQFISGSNALWDKASPRGKVKRNISLPSLGTEQLCLEIDVKNEEIITVPSRRQSIWRKISEKYEECEMLDLYESEQAKVANKKRTDLVVHGKKAKPSLATDELQMPSSAASASLEQNCGFTTWYSALSGGSKSVMESDTYISPPPAVHDIFEVPESHKDCTRGEPCKKECSKESNNTTSMPPNQLWQESVDNVRKDNDWINWAFMTSYHRNKLRSQSKSSLFNHCSRLATPTRGNSFDLCAYGETGSSQIDCEQLTIRLKQLEDQHIAMQKDTERGKEQMKLLRDIFKQLNSIETHMKTSTSMTEQRSSQEDSKVVSVMEAVLSFSI